MQVADRLVSLARGQRLEALDRSANKLIMYVARDAHVSIGYAGQAFMGKVPTDEFIAQILAGETFTRGAGQFCGVRIGGRIPRYDIGLAVDKVMQALVPAIRHNQVIQLMIAGHQFNRRGLVRPLAMRVELTSKGVQLARKFPRNVPQGFAIVDAIGLSPPGAEMSEICKSIFQNPEVTKLKQVATKLTDAVRRNGAPGIGLHTSAIMLPVPGQAPIETGFFPVSPHYGILKDGGRSEPFVADISPWIIAPGLIKPPSFEIGGMNYNAGGLQFITNGAPDRTIPDGGGPIFAFSTMPRFDLPASVQ